MNSKESKIAYLLTSDIKTEREVRLLQELGYEVKIVTSTKALHKVASEQQNLTEYQNNIDQNKSSIVNCFASLTKREREVVKHLVLGDGVSSNKAIAKIMDISHRTVEEYRASAMRKMDSKSLKELITKVISHDLFSTNQSNS